LKDKNYLGKMSIEQEDIYAVLSFAAHLTQHNALKIWQHEISV
jgi:hypothetical protein